MYENDIIESDSSVVIEDVFKKKFKYYKSNKPKPSLHEVLSVDSTCDFVEPAASKHYEDKRVQLFGLRNVSEWKMFSFKKHPGLFLIRNPFTTTGQRYWIRKCLEVYPRKPNKKNIDIEVNLQDWWVSCYEHGKCDRILQNKLRWTTLGYHHNWDTKIYSDDNKSTFPEDLAELSDVVAKYLNFDNFHAEAAIVNYYHMDSTLSPHTDHSEVNLEAPLLSFSFGQTAIFLLGGQDKSVEPSAIYLKSGDIVVMSNEARLCYHSVPKILPAETEPWNNPEDQNIPNYEGAFFKYILNNSEMFCDMRKLSDQKEWSVFNEYIKKSRINMNVRQVLNKNQINLTNCNNSS